MSQFVVAGLWSALVLSVASLWRISKRLFVEDTEPLGRVISAIFCAIAILTIYSVWSVIP